MVEVGTALAGVAGALLVGFALLLLYRLIVVGVPAGTGPGWAVPVTGVAALAMVVVGGLVVWRAWTGQPLTTGLLAVALAATLATAAASELAGT